MNNTGFTGSTIIRLDSVDSTNNYAAKLVKEGKVFDGTVIMTYNQTNGRGQRGKNWISNTTGNLTFSIICYPKMLGAKEYFLLSKVTSLAVSDLLNSYQIKNKVKWPNDCYTSNGKIAGILIENGLHGNQLEYSIVGIGINVNDHPNQPEFRSSSIRDELQYAIDPEAVLKDFLKHFDHWYLHLRNSNFTSIKNTYEQRLMGINELANYSVNEKTVKAIVKSVENDGKIILETNEGEIISGYMDEIKRVP